MTKSIAVGSTTTQTITVQTREGERTVSRSVKVIEPANESGMYRIEVQGEHADPKHQDYMGAFGWASESDLA